ncbi:thermonuclease family protein [Mycoplasma bradburyae]|uniref:thermonuclease family protein n=1 Tax=Mycoplasma bradburyae TaxID=2963128 RepID=UPI0023422CEE|nr:thermonuclease family protein [Mycoplasma bradburyae]MDC4182566.1 thermonuclease family protein [Mycoplasma bradburyae]
MSGLLGIMAPIVSSCNNGNNINIVSNNSSNDPTDSLAYWDDLYKQYGVTKFSDEQVSKNLKKAKLLKWRDGDTPEIQFYENNDSDELTDQINAIRIESIDTPEKTKVNQEKERVPSDEPELTYAKKATELAQKTIPEGNDVYFWYANAKSYDRLVGTIYYDFNKENKAAISFSATMVLNGLAIPIIKSPTDLLDTSSELYVATKPVAIAANIAILNKRNIWSADNNLSKSIETIYKVRGADTSWVSFLNPKSNNYKIYAKKGDENYAQSVWNFLE